MATTTTAKFRHDETERMNQLIILCLCRFILLVHAVSAVFLAFFLYRFHSFFSAHLIHTILHYNSIMSTRLHMFSYILFFLCIPMSMPWCSLSALNCANSSFFQSLSYFFLLWFKYLYDEVLIFWHFFCVSLNWMSFKLMNKKMSIYERSGWIFIKGFW